MTMIKLLKFPPGLGLPDPSPFCMKAELLLKMADLAYEPVICVNPRKGPKGKLPAIADDGGIIGDSEFIRRHLERKYIVDFDKGLGARERATAHAFARMLEERTYWVAVYERWIDERNWPVVRAALFGGLPPPLRSLVPFIARRKVRDYLHGQGLGRHTRDEVYALGAADIRAVAEALGDKAYFMGSAPTGVDATIYAFVAALLVPPFESPVKDEIRRHANLVAYAERMRARYYG